MPFREHTTAARLGDYQCVFDLGLLDQEIDVGSIETRQPRSKRKTVVGPDESGTCLLEGPQHGVVMGRGGTGVASTAGDRRQAIVSCPAQLRVRVRLARIC